MKSKRRTSMVEAGWVATVCLAVWAFASWLNTFIEYRSIAIVFLMAVVASGVFLSRSSVLIIAAVLSLVHNFFFIPPLYTFAIRDPQDVLTYIIFFISAFAIGHLTSRLREQKHLIETREDRAVQLFHLAGAMSEANSTQQVLFAGTEALERNLGAEIQIIFPSDKQESDVGARMATETGAPAGRFTKVLPNEPVTYIPLQSRKVAIGIAALRFPRNAQMDADRFRFAQALVGQIAAGLEREYLHESRKKLDILEQADRLSKALFDSISHELKTPLTTIKGATSALLTEHDKLSVDVSRDLLSQIGEQSERILTVVNNMLDMTRLESGTMRPNIGTYDIADLLGPSLKQIDAEKGMRSIHTRIAENTHPLLCDAPLVVQALTNILCNSITHTSVDGRIEIGAHNGPDHNVVIEIEDNGPGLPTGDPAIVFQKFYRNNPQKSGGVGLGLSIAKGFIEVQKGTLLAANRPEGGARFTMIFPAAAP